ncbi:MAG: metallophosphoesterase [Lentisphaeria bacterium]|jgi:2',3'-cyclic-nucleotide 2'-phosphodiesterase (5'-nucleotidase family)|nr:metallophosphoesterase [Lentisphaeria bacterium]
MNRLIRPLALLLLLAVGLAAQTADLRILHTSDLHASLEQGREEGSGGMLRIATLIRRLRAEAGPERTLLVDGGDTCQGSLVGALTQGAIGPAFLNAVGYDIWVPGNHEFDFGPPRYAELSDTFKGTLLCGNVRVPVDGTLRSWPGRKMIERGGARLAVIGANASYLRNWYIGEAANIEEDRAVDQLAALMPEILRAKPDANVLAIHQGYKEADHRNVNEIPEIVRQFPEIDLILGAHTHLPRPGQRLGVKTWYVQPPSQGASLVQVDLRLDLANKQVASIESKLVEAGADIPHDEGVLAAVGSMLETARTAAAQPVGSLARPLAADGTPGIDCATAELLCRVLAEAARCPVVVHGKLSPLGLAAGPVHEAQLFDLVPYENEIFTARLTPAQLATVVAEQWRNRKSYVFCGLYGVAATLDPNGKTAELAPLPAAALDPDGRVLVAFNSYTAAGGGGRFPELAGILAEPASQLRGIGISTRDALRDHLARNPNLGLAPQAWLLPKKN